MTGVLKGVRVVELSTMITAPLTGLMLADLGAEVIKVEPPGGDPFRSFRGGLYSPNFVAYNRGKRSIKLDLRTDAGRAVLLKLLARADVLLENYRAGMMDRLGLGAESCTPPTRRLIHCSITGFGATGPYSARPAYDNVGAGAERHREPAARSAASAGRAARPSRTTPPACSPATASSARCTSASAPAAAGASRSTCWKPAIAFIPDPFANYTRAGIDNDRLTRVASSHSFAFRCGDGKLLAVHLSSQPKFWEGLLAALERPDLLRRCAVCHPRAADQELSSS